MTPETCPNCGADVPTRARACPECGADEKTGWSDDAKYQSMGIPTESFDYDEFVQEEFGERRSSTHRSKKKRFWQIVAAVLFVGIIYYLVRGWWR
ncbi:MAG: zinc ribbon domain-containing protein [Pedosphaera sp.]|nr:zinc ribbon domain-containing protein [Pedosphaera sp.]